MVGGIDMTMNDAPTPGTAMPPVVRWFRVYCWVLGVIYLAVALFSLWFFLGDPEVLEMTRTAAIVVGAGVLLMGLVLLGASVLPLTLRPRPWLWTYSLVLIGIGMTSACFLPFCIPLLIFWLKPETKSYFARES
jgi:hypothetical protein